VSAAAVTMKDSAPLPDRTHRGRLAPVLLALVLGFAPAAWAQGGGPHAAGPIQIFFPAPPPPLGSALPPPAAAAAGALPAPPALAPFAYDPFYAPLSTRMARNEIGADLQFQLDSYQASKTALQTELRAKLDTLKDADPGVRWDSLEEFAREQTPRIAELEAVAERLRQGLVHSGSSRREYMRWQIDFATETTSDRTDEGARLREAVQMELYYHDGLSPEQRRLLREVGQQGAQGGGWLLFCPEPAIVHVAADLPPALAAKIMAYAREKSALKSQILDTLYPRQKTPGDPAHVAALRALAAAQAPRFVALQGRAEDIRRGLAALQDPALGPELPPLPAELSDRIEAYRRDKLALQRELLARVDAVPRTPGGNPADQAERIRQAITAFTEGNAARYTALEKSQGSIHADLARLPAAPAVAGDAASTDALLKKFSDSLGQLQSYWNYRDYQTAVFQPGLSPEQRRLLLDGALQKLALPLPGAEIDPGRR